MTYAQYDKNTGFICATNSVMVSDEILAEINRAQIDISNQIFEGKMVDLVTFELIDDPSYDIEPEN